MANWHWELTDTAIRDFEHLEDQHRARIISKLDVIVSDEWRTPADYVEPLTGVPHSKLRIGPYRLGCRLDRQEKILYVLRIRTRGKDAYRDDD